MSFRLLDVASQRVKLGLAAASTTTSAGIPGLKSRCFFFSGRSPRALSL